MKRWKYNEGEILRELEEYLKNTYSEHYVNDDKNIECFDAWIALGDSGPTFRNTAIKYLWRYGKKKGKNKDDLFKALHYIFMLMYVEHHRDNFSSEIGQKINLLFEAEEEARNESKFQGQKKTMIHKYD